MFLLYHFNEFSVNKKPPKRRFFIGSNYILGLATTVWYPIFKGKFGSFSRISLTRLGRGLFKLNVYTELAEVRQMRQWFKLIFSIYFLGYRSHVSHFGLNFGYFINRTSKDVINAPKRKESKATSHHFIFIFKIFIEEALLNFDFLLQKQ